MQILLGSLRKYTKILKILTKLYCSFFLNFRTEVELGEYNILTKIDCVFETDIEECNDPVGDYEIEKIVVHPNYNTECITNNIALLRLRKKLFFNGNYFRIINIFRNN